MPGNKEKKETQAGQRSSNNMQTAAHYCFMLIEIKRIELIKVRKFLIVHNCMENNPNF